MKDIEKEQPTIKQYLLGHLDEEGRQQFEEQFMTDSEFREAALVVEGELLDHYLAGLLPPAERESFVNHYLATPRHVQELELARALREYALREEQMSLRAGADVPLPPPVRHKEIGRQSSGRRWVPALALAAVLLIALVVTGRMFWGDTQAARNAEVALLNRQPRSDEASLTVPLTHVLRRDAEQSPKVSIPSGTNVVELHLTLPGQLQPTPPGQREQVYQATLRVADGAEVFSVGDLRPEAANGGQAVRLRVPARLLTPQDYILSVSERPDAGQPEAVAEYFFRVVR